MVRRPRTRRPGGDRHHSAATLFPPFPTLPLSETKQLARMVAAGLGFGPPLRRGERVASGGDHRGARIAARVEELPLDGGGAWRRTHFSDAPSKFGSGLLSLLLDLAVVVAGVGEWWNGGTDNEGSS